MQRPTFFFLFFFFWCVQVLQDNGTLLLWALRQWRSSQSCRQLQTSFHCKNTDREQLQPLLWLELKRRVWFRWALLKGSVLPGFWPQRQRAQPGLDGFRPFLCRHAQVFEETADNSRLQITFRLFPRTSTDRRARPDEKKSRSFYCNPASLSIICPPAELSGKKVDY